MRYVIYHKSLGVYLGKMAWSNVHNPSKHPYVKSFRTEDGAACYFQGMVDANSSAYGQLPPVEIIAVRGEVDDVTEEDCIAAGLPGWSK